MSKVIKIKRGLDIRLKGPAERSFLESRLPELFAIKPTDFKGIVPKVTVKPGQEVRAGEPVMCDKVHPGIIWVSPVSGVVEAVNRGERRKLLDVVIRGAASDDFVPLLKADPKTLGAEQVREQILQSGLWPALIQRPYGVVANPGVKPRDIFISGFDTAPLAPDLDLILQDEAAGFKAGVEALKKLTTGKVYVSLPEGYGSSGVMPGVPGVEYNYFSGPHPSGLAGIQIHHLAPINKGEVVWTVSPQHVARIGNSFLKGHADTRWVVALTGSGLKRTGYLRTRMGACINGWLDGNLNDQDSRARVISGNVLTGSMINPENYIGYYDSHITVIPEGDHYDLFGWAIPGYRKFSNSRAFLSALNRNRDWDLDTNLKGGHRAFVVTGQYEKVLPMDILPVFLLKAVLAEDIDRMEQLGIYEVIEEDFALCEFVCSSKIDVQDILRTGLDLMRKELS
ncbi:MAG: Na(+)-translocating NADH-quinone reductase subunit A [Bacteroidales bacterium]